MFLLCIRSLSSSQTTSRDAKPTQHIDTTHPDNVNFKLVFHKAASFYPHYLTFTPQTYHHPLHRFRSWPTQMPSPITTVPPLQNRTTHNTLIPLHQNKDTFQGHGVVSLVEVGSCCCCFPFETYGSNGVTPIFRSFHRTVRSITGDWSRCNTY